MGRRDWRVDTLRGYFLVCMTLGHFPNPLAKITAYTFGYAASPDGFVFLSGLVSARVYLLLQDKRGTWAMVSRVYRRVGTIYLTHMALVATALFAALFSSVGAQRLAHAWQALAAGALLINQHGFDRILPMYIVFLALTPLVLKLLCSGRAWLLGAISAALWLGAQFGLGDWSGAEIAASHGNFNLFAWQAYFVAGLYFGYRAMQAGEDSLPKSRVLLAACGVIAALLMIDRHLGLVGRHPWFGFSGHPDHNPVRFLDAACLGYIVWRVPRAVDVVAMKLRFFQFLNLLGRHSLQVFAFSMLLTRFEAHSMDGLSWIAKLIVAVLTVLSLSLAAEAHEFWRRGGLRSRGELSRAQAPIRIRVEAASEVGSAQ